jgi:adenylosuccinate synthase
MSSFIHSIITVPNIAVLSTCLSLYLANKFFKKYDTDKKNEVHKSKYYSVCGLMFGDEGKGKLVDALIQRGINEYGASNTIVCGINGGSNAGHTTCIDGIDYHTHFLPSGAVSDDVILYCGSSKVLEPMSLDKELYDLSFRFKDIPKRTYMSELIQYTTIGHLIIDQGEIGKTIGTTGKGIGITYATECTRTGLNLYDIVNCTEDELINKLNKLYQSLGLDEYPRDTILYTLDKQCDDGTYKKINVDYDILFSFKYDLENIARFKNTWKNIVPSTYFVEKLLEPTNKYYVMEMSNAVLLDKKHGSYPNVTSSSCTPNGILDSLSLNLTSDLIKDLKIVGVAKSYVTRVGTGTLPTDIRKDNKQVADTIVECGKEYGVTTGRRRTPGWIDIPALKYAISVSGATAINITRLDNFSNIDKIKICIKYRSSDKTTDSNSSSTPNSDISDYSINTFYPSIEAKLSKVEPVYIEIDGWNGFDFTKVKKYDDLHPNVKTYLDIIEQFTGIKVWAINTGKDRDKIIFLD